MYWEKVEFGMKPTIHVNHAVIYNGKAEGRDVSVVAIKQLYASHYFHTALDLSVCVADASAPDGFYLLTLKGSEQEGLTGIKGSVLRQVAVGKIRGSLESALAFIKRTIEQSAPAAERWRSSRRRTASGATGSEDPGSGSILSLQPRAAMAVRIDSRL